MITIGGSTKLRIANGAALIKLNEGSEMRVVYGKDALL